MKGKHYHSQISTFKIDAPAHGTWNLLPVKKLATDILSKCHSNKTSLKKCNLGYVAYS